MVAFPADVWRYGHSMLSCAVIRNDVDVAYVKPHVQHIRWFYEVNVVREKFVEMEIFIFSARSIKAFTFYKQLY